MTTLAVFQASMSASLNNEAPKNVARSEVTVAGNEFGTSTRLVIPTKAPSNDVVPTLPQSKSEVNLAAPDTAAARPICGTSPVTLIVLTPDVAP